MRFLSSQAATYKSSTSNRKKQNKNTRKQATKQDNFCHVDNNKNYISEIKRYVVRKESKYAHIFILNTTNI
jgi:hypothetical protein